MSSQPNLGGDFCCSDFFHGTWLVGVGESMLQTSSGGISAALRQKKLSLIY